MFDVNTATSSNRSFSPEFNVQALPMDVQFSPASNSGMTLYRGVERVWLGDGTKTYNGSPDYGVLYADMVDGNTATLGPVTGFYYAKQAGFSGTFSDWVNVIVNSSSYADQIYQIKTAIDQSKTDAEAWAVGTRNGVAVKATDITYENNAKYYANLFDLSNATTATDAEIDSLFAD